MSQIINKYDPSGRLSYAGAQATIAAGGSVLVGTQIHHKGNPLPSEAEFAKGDPSQRAAAKESIKQQIAALKAQQALLDEDEVAKADKQATPAKADAAKPATPAAK